MKNMERSNNVKSALDQEVKAIHGLLQKLTHQERIEYIKEMIPSLLTSPHEITSSSQRLADKQMTPFTNLSQEQRKLIDDLADNTERLYKSMNDEY
jgi:hypothetical protein